MKQDFNGSSNSDEIARLHEVAQSNFQAGKLKKSIDSYLEITQLDRKNAEAYYKLGVICFQLNQPSEAMGFAKVAALLKPENQKFKKSIGDFLIAEKLSLDQNMQKATHRHYNLKLKTIKNPGNAELLLEYVEYLMAEFRFTWDVMYHLFRIQDLIPNEVYPYELMAKVWRRLGNHQAAYEQAKKAISIDPNSADGLVIAGRCMRHFERWEEAAHYLERALKLTPTRFGALRAMGEVRLALGQNNKAKVAYETALKTAPARAELIYGLGQADLGLKNNREAQESFEECLDKDPLHLGATIGLFKSLIRRGRLIKAIKILWRQIQMMYLQAKDIELSGSAEKPERKSDALSSIVAVVIVLLIRVLSRFLTIRFLPIDGTHLAIITGYINFYYCERKHGLHPKRTFDILYYDQPPCNLQVDRMWRRRLFIVGMAKIWDKLNVKIMGGARHRAIIQTLSWYNEADSYDTNWTTPAPVFLNKKERQHGEECLKEMGIPEGAEFICFHNRDNAYVKTVNPDGYRKTHAYRDSSIHDYLPAAREMNKLGLYAVRLGQVVKEEIPDHNSMIIDYPNHHRTELMDVFLSSRCRFYLGSTSGLTYLPKLFRKPTIGINVFPFGHLGETEVYDIFIPKRIWSHSENRFLTFTEILGSCLSFVLLESEIQMLNLELINNSPEDITSATLEMAARLNGTWVTTSRDEELQIKFWSLYPSTMSPGIRRRRIGAEFLRENSELLSDF